MLFPPEYVFLWLLFLFGVSYYFFRKKALLFWAVITPVVLAIKMGVPHIVISTGVGTAMAAVAFSLLTKGELKRIEYPDGHPVRDQYKALEFSLKAPLWFAVAVTLIVNIATAWLISAFFNADQWMAEKDLSEDLTFGVPVAISFVTASVILCAGFMSTRKVPPDEP